MVHTERGGCAAVCDLLVVCGLRVRVRRQCGRLHWVRLSAVMGPCRTAAAFLVSSTCALGLIKSL